MVTNTLWLRGVPKCKKNCLPPPFHTGTPHIMVTGTVFLAIHLVTHWIISFLPKQATCTQANIPFCIWYYIAHSHWCIIALPFGDHTAIPVPLSRYFCFWIFFYSMSKEHNLSESPRTTAEGQQICSGSGSGNGGTSAAAAVEVEVAVAEGVAATDWAIVGVGGLEGDALRHMNAFYVLLKDWFVQKINTSVLLTREGYNKRLEFMKTGGYCPRSLKERQLVLYRRPGDRVLYTATAGEAAPQTVVHAGKRVGYAHRNSKLCQNTHSD